MGNLDNEQSNDNNKQSPTADYTMFDWMNMVFHSDQEPLTPAQLVTASEIVISGYIDSITAGRTIINTHDLPNTPPLKTSLVKVEVIEIFKGKNVDNYVYFEYPSGSIPPSLLDKSKYKGEVVLFLGKTGWNEDTYLFYDSPDGLMNEVDQLYGLTRDSSFFIESFDQVVRPLNDGIELDSPVRNFEELKEVISDQLNYFSPPYFPEEVSDKIKSPIE